MAMKPFWGYLVAITFLVVALSASFSYGIPLTANEFYGNWTINGSDAPVGVTLSVLANGVACGSFIVQNRH
ncbi:hypothetical protein J4475_02110 [Candidatus Woesearchaeota archaeon]|nr:hypothetical protein [Candidatus Woesearchaeota archaeon]